jgi:hypothetical protein
MWAQDCLLAMASPNPLAKEDFSQPGAETKLKLSFFF